MRPSFFWYSPSISFLPITLSSGVILRSRRWACSFYHPSLETSTLPRSETIQAVPECLLRESLSGLTPQRNVRKTPHKYSTRQLLTAPLRMKAASVRLNAAPVRQNKNNKGNFLSFPGIKLKVDTLLHLQNPDRQQNRRFRHTVVPSGLSPDASPAVFCSHFLCRTRTASPGYK